MRSLLAGLALLALALPTPSRAQAPITIVVNFVAGGPSDLMGRLLAPELAAAMGTQVVIKNSAGAAGGIGAAEVARARPDGTTLLLSPIGAMAIQPHFRADLPHRPTDFAPICNLVALPIIVAAKRGFRFPTLAAMVAEARARPESISIGTPGIGSSPYLAAEVMARAAGIKLLHVPYPGIAPAMTALIAGDIDLVVGAPGIVMPAVESHGVIPLVQTGANRVPTLPNLTTLREGGFDVDQVTRFGLFAPKETPPAILARLERVFLDAAAAPAYVEAMRRAYNEVFLQDRAQFAAALAAEDRATARLITELDIK